VEDRELVGLVLAGRDALGGRRIHRAATEESFEHRVSESAGRRHRAIPRDRIDVERMTGRPAPVRPMAAIE